MIYVFYSVLAICAVTAFVSLLYLVLHADRCNINVKDGDQEVEISTTVPLGAETRVNFESNLVSKIREEMLRRSRL